MSRLFPTLLLTALGCTGAPTPETDAVYAYGAALSSEDTLHAREACLALTDEALRVDCVWRLAEKEAQRNRPLARAICLDLDGREKAECIFRIADFTADPTLCPDTAPFDAQCRTHVFRERLYKAYSAPLRVDEVETKSAALIQELGFPPDQDSLWLSAWLWAFKALDAPPVAACGVEDTAAQRSCRFALWQVWPELKPVEVRAGVPAGVDTRP